MVQKGGGQTWLQAALSAPTFHLLLCGPASGGDARAVAALPARYAPLLTVTPLVRTSDPDHAEYLVDVSGTALSRLGVRDAAQLLVRPDGHLCYRSDGLSLDGVDRYLACWLRVRAVTERFA